MSNPQLYINASSAPEKCVQRPDTRTYVSSVQPVKARYASPGDPLLEDWFEAGMSVVLREPAAIETRRSVVLAQSGKLADAHY